MALETLMGTSEWISWLGRPTPAGAALLGAAAVVWHRRHIGGKLVAYLHTAISVLGGMALSFSACVATLLVLKDQVVEAVDRWPLQGVAGDQCLMLAILAVAFTGLMGYLLTCFVK